MPPESLGLDERRALERGDVFDVRSDCGTAEAIRSPHLLVTGEDVPQHEIGRPPIQDQMMICPRALVALIADAHEGKTEQRRPCKVEGALSIGVPEAIQF